MINLDDELTEKLLAVLQGQPQYRVLNALGRFEAITKAFCRPGSSEPFAISVIPLVAKESVGTQ